MGNKRKGGLTEQELVDQTGQNPELEALRTQNRALLRDLDRKEMALESEERLFDRVEAAVHALPRVRKAPKVQAAPSHADMQAVLILTDEHAEEIVRTEEMEGLARYDWDTFLGRSWKVIEKTVELVNIERQSSNVSKLHIWKLGDQCTGDIHAMDSMVAQEWGLPEAVPNVAFIFAQQVATLAAHFEEIEVTGVVGNHTRTTRKPAYKLGAERNWDRAIYRIAKMMTGKQDNVSWNIPESMQTVVNVMGWDNYLTHGAEIPMNNRVPYYPIESTMQRQAGMRRQARRWMEAARVPCDIDVEFDLTWMGHYHHRAVLADSIYLCPSLIGANQYSKSKVHSMSMPRQMLVFFTEKHGVTLERVINLMQAEGHGFVDPRDL